MYALAPRPMELGSPSWYVLMLLAGLAVGVVIAIAQKVWKDRQRP